MNLQWHRGTQSAMNHKMIFYFEVKEKVDKGEAVCKDEKVRLMSIGRGLWHNTAFYQYFEEKYGAVSRIPCTSLSPRTAISGTPSMIPSGRWPAVISTWDTVFATPNGSSTRQSGTGSTGRS